MRTSLFYQDGVDLDAKPAKRGELEDILSGQIPYLHGDCGADDRGINVALMICGYDRLTAGKMFATINPEAKKGVEDGGEKRVCERVKSLHGWSSGFCGEGGRHLLLTDG